VYCLVGISSFAVTRNSSVGSGINLRLLYTCNPATRQKWVQFALSNIRNPTCAHTDVCRLQFVQPKSILDDLIRRSGRCRRRRLHTRLSRRQSGDSQWQQGTCSIPKDSYKPALMVQSTAKTPSDPSRSSKSSTRNNHTQTASSKSMASK